MYSVRDIDRPTGPENPACIADCGDRFFGQKAGSAPDAYNLHRVPPIIRSLAIQQDNPYVRYVFSKTGRQHGLRAGNFR